MTMNSVCNYCKHLTDVNREVAPDRGWCPMWQKWQKTTACACKYFEQKEQPQRKNGRFPTRVGNYSRPQAPRH